MVQESKDALWVAQDVADFLGVKKGTVYTWAQQGHLPSVRVGRLLRFDPDAIRSIKERGLPTEGAA